MISFECMDAYRKQYPQDECAPEEPGDVMITRSFDRQSFVPPKDETNEIFMDRLERSKKADRNLFYEEWKPFEYEDDCDY